MVVVVNHIGGLRGVARNISFLTNNLSSRTKMGGR
jgi:hypothetical protein